MFMQLVPTLITLSYGVNSFSVYAWRQELYSTKSSVIKATTKAATQTAPIANMKNLYKTVS